MHHNDSTKDGSSSLFIAEHLLAKTTFASQRFAYVLKQQLLIEILWILLAVLVTGCVLFPVFLSVGAFPYHWDNAILIFSFITVLRLLFFHKQSPWLKPKPMKAVLCVAMVPLFLFTMLTINNVQTFVDANGFASLFNVAESASSIQWGRFVKNEVVFFGAGLLICCIILPVVLIIEVWRQVKGFD